jgi:hypothetical protein
MGIPVVYEIRAFWEDAAVDHGTTTEGSLRYRATARWKRAPCVPSMHVTPSAKACASTSSRAACRSRR